MHVCVCVCIHVCVCVYEYICVMGGQEVGREARLTTHTVPHLHVMMLPSPFSRLTSQPQTQRPPPSSRMHKCRSSRPHECDSPTRQMRGHSGHTPSPQPQKKEQPKVLQASQAHWQSPLLGQIPRFQLCHRCRLRANRTAPSASPAFLPPPPAREGKWMSWGM